MMFMPDMLVNLLKLPPLERALVEAQQSGALIRRAQPFELTPVRAFVEQHFTLGWADELAVGFQRQPVSVYLATRAGEIVGFAAYECTRRAFFGPTGVLPAERGHGLGTALLLASLYGLREMGYVYGIIGSAGPTAFYQRTVGAIPIPDSEPGIYTDLLKAVTSDE
jgi:GNAT superfamily N-acetyltransferase